MRICADEKDPGYENYAAMRLRKMQPEILLNGQIIENVVWADDEAGELARVVVEGKDERGFTRYKIEGDHFALEVLHGKVEIVQRPDKAQ